jgi:APA family basic amino acid/polyamine antiporter
VSVTALVVGQVIAVGIFLTPAGMAKALGSPFWLLVAWLTMGAMALCGAWCYGELAARFPEPGGGYVYLRRAYGPGVAFLYGWKCLMVMDPGLTAALGVGLASYAGYLIALSPVGIKAVAIAVIVSLAVVNVLGLRMGAGLMRWLTGIKLGALAAIAIAALGAGAGDWSNFHPFVAQRAGSAPLPGALAPALVGAFFAFGGWWEVSKMAGETRDPARTMPRGLALGVIIVTVVYVVTSAVFLYLVPPEDVTSGETFAAQAGEKLFGPAGGRVFAAIVVVSVLGSLAGFLMALPRVYYAMARDGVFFHAIGAVHPRFGTPARAIILQATLACLLVILGTFNQIVAYFIFATVAFIALTVAAVFVLRRRVAGAPAYGIPGYPVPVVVFLALALGLLVILAAVNPLQASLGAAIVALGIPVYLVWFRARRGLKKPTVA